VVGSGAANGGGEGESIRHDILELAGTEIVPADEDFIGQREDYHSPFMHGIYGRGLSQGLVGSLAALPSTSLLLCCTCRQPPNTESGPSAVD
jgi:hypothetical protein